MSSREIPFIDIASIVFESSFSFTITLNDGHEFLVMKEDGPTAWRVVDCNSTRARAFNARSTEAALLESLRMVGDSLTSTNSDRT